MEDWAAASLSPPPYTGACSTLVEGLELRDPLLEGVPMKQLLAMAHGRDDAALKKIMAQQGEPLWVDFARVKRGQALWRENLGAAYIALMAALMLGFCIARFAVVLVVSGYASSTQATWQRFRATGFAVMDWLTFDLQGPGGATQQPPSLALCSIYRVRCMHELARRRVLEDDVAATLGVPLSQYDLGVVLLAFSGICFDIMEREIGASALLPSERRDMVAVWRLIGWHLGIEDRFNACRDCATLDATCEDFMRWVPQRFASVRPETLTMLLAVCRAFGSNSPLGVDWYVGWVTALLASPHRPSWGVLHGRQLWAHAEPLLRPRLGMPSVAWGMVRFAGGSKWASRALGARLLAMRELHRDDPEFARKFEANANRTSRLFDGYLWPVFSAICTLIRLPLRLCALALPWKSARCINAV